MEVRKVIQMGKWNYENEKGDMSIGKFPMNFHIVETDGKCLKISEGA